MSHDYIWSGDRLLAEVTDDYILKFFYDASGNVLGFEYLTPTTDASGNTDYTGTTYYYEKNIFGDVVAIYDENGTKVGAYGFNSYGQNNVVTNLTDDSIASLNPIRYRSYYYDTDIYLYYLQSRYYDPVTCRFINADSQISDVGGEILGYNMFAYCFNNPVNMSDSTGNWPKWATKLIVAVAVVTVVTVVAVATAGTGTAIAAIAAGAAKGAAIGFAVGATSGAAIGYATTGTLEGTLNGMADGALSGAVTGAITGGFQGYSSFSATQSFSSTQPFQVDSRITEALKKLDATGIRPGQTEISQSGVLAKFNSYNNLTASSSYTQINGNLYVSEGHHTMIANVMKYGKLNSGINMGQYVYDPNVVTNMMWSTLKIVP